MKFKDVISIGACVCLSVCYDTIRVAFDVFIIVAKKSLSNSTTKDTPDAPIPEASVTPSIGSWCIVG